MNCGLLLIGYNRPDFIALRLEELIASNIIFARIYVSIDYCSDVNIAKEMKMVLAPYRGNPGIQIIFRGKNYGCSDHILLAVTEVLSRHDSIIVVEDDVSVNNNFLESTTNAIKRGVFDSDVAIIGGFSPFLGRTPIPNFWRKSRYFCAWGWATSKPFWESFVRLEDSSDWKDRLEATTLWGSLSKKKQRVWLTRFERGVWDYQMQFNLFLTGRKVYLPWFRMIDNEGFSDSRSTHTRHAPPKMLRMRGHNPGCPVFIPHLDFLTRVIWRWLDSNIWAGDGFFNPRSRSRGVRTLMKIFSSRTKLILASLKKLILESS